MRRPRRVAGQPVRACPVRCRRSARRWLRAVPGWERRQRSRYRRSWRSAACRRRPAQTSPVSHRFQFLSRLEAAGRGLSEWLVNARTASGWDQPRACRSARSRRAQAGRPSSCPLRSAMPLSIAPHRWWQEGDIGLSSPLTLVDRLLPVADSAVPSPTMPARQTSGPSTLRRCFPGRQEAITERRINSCWPGSLSPVRRRRCSRGGRRCRPGPSGSLRHTCASRRRHAG